MNPLSDEQLSSLGNHLVIGAHTHSRAVMTRGRAIRRHHRLNTGVTVAAATTMVIVLGWAGLIRLPGPHLPAPSNTPAPSAVFIGPTCQPELGKQPAPTSPGVVPEIIYLVDPSPSAAVSATLTGSQRTCNEPITSGADLSPTGTFKRWFSLSNDGSIEGTDLALTPVRGGEGLVQGGVVQWVENGRNWVWQSEGMTRDEMMSAVSRLKSDPSDPIQLIVPPDLMDVVVRQTGDQAGPVWTVTYGSGQSRWSLSVESNWAANGPPLNRISGGITYPDRVLDIGGQQVLLVGDSATWVDAQGHRFETLNAPAEQLPDIVEHTVKVAPDDPRVTSIFSRS